MGRTDMLSACALAHTAHVLPITQSQWLVFCRILSHNPLSAINDTSFFELPSVKYL